MGIKGELATMGLEDIFQWLAVGRKTGVLHLNGLVHRKKVDFHDGRISGCWSSDPREYLGQFLLSFNRITEAQLRDALAAQEDENQLLGRILVNRQLLTEEEIRQVLQQKVEESIYDAFLWGAGHFEFMDGEAPADKATALNLDVTGVVMEGTRRRDEWQRIRMVLKGPDAVLDGVSEVIADHLPLAPVDAAILAQVDGARTVEQVAAELRWSEFKVSHHLMEMLDKGMLTVVDPGGHAGERIQARVAEAEGHLDAGRLAEAEAVLAALLKESPSLAQAQRLMDRLEEAKGALFPPPQESDVPILAVSLDQLMTANLSANEGFLASRVDSISSVGEIIAVMPLPPEECIALFTRLLRKGILRVEGTSPTKSVTRFH
jgi:hypothetical protein